MIADIYRTGTLETNFHSVGYVSDKNEIYLWVECEMQETTQTLLADYYRYVEITGGVPTTGSKGIALEIRDLKFGIRARYDVLTHKLRIYADTFTAVSASLESIEERCMAQEEAIKKHIYAFLSRDKIQEIITASLEQKE